MDVYEAIRKRKSVRRYKDKEVEQEKLTRILEAARLAPSASNKQEWRFVVVQDKEKRRKLSAEAARGQKFVEEAPVVIACCAETDNHEMTCGQLCYPIDVAIAIDHITLAAVEEDLGTCWIGAFYEDKAKNILNIPDRIRIVELLTLGYPADDSIKKKSRLPIETIVKWEKWE
ncbi:nitroreductase family protein [Candidatus Borrarchaeum sp.]|uniref:nitroreductase family protein n=1 Tax=Candidatus Borrarchaeum sp. TaxID=2846742 RepID=UPI00257DBCB0|nr:nitroreductase family protein [Candidatus Borrarchaeum sp.]